MKIKDETIYAYALKNALEHGGKAIVGAVINSLFTEGLEKKNIKHIIPKVQDIINEINDWDPEVQNKEYKKYEKSISHREEREGLPDLPIKNKNKNKKIITRMSPSPSGPLHIGHILTILPNYLYTQKYKGKFIIRIEDTNPDNIYKPAYKMIEQEAKWLCKNKVKIIVQSDNLKSYYKTAELLINKNTAYICTCNQEKFKELIHKKQACPCRTKPKTEQIERWQKMLDKTKNSFKPGQAVLRFKGNLNDNNPAMRDFPLARINTTSHPLQKNKYKVWPLMNLAVTTDDIKQKITHVIRGKDHKDNAKRQLLIYKALNKKPPWTAFIGRLHLKDLTLSSSKILEQIKKRKYKSWDDPKLPTLSSLKKQGYKPETFYKFGEQRGISEADKIITLKDLQEILFNFQKNKIKK